MTQPLPHAAIPSQPIMRRDTGATRRTLPPFVADQLGLLRLHRTDAPYADGRVEEVDITEGLLIELMGRRVTRDAIVLGTWYRERSETLAALQRWPR